MNINNTLQKLKSIIKNGYLPCRFNERYTRETSILANCFSHSCFNLTNKMLSNFTFEDSNVIGLLDGNEKNKTVEILLNFVSDAGLEISECQMNDKTNWNQWKVSAYFTSYYNSFCGDYHFIKQEKDFSWSSKNGFQEEVFFLNNVNTSITNNYQDYFYHSSYIITNPYAKNDISNQTLMEEVWENSRQL